MPKFPEITEQRGRTIDARCKIIATIAVLIGGGWSLESYLMNRSDAANPLPLKLESQYLRNSLKLVSPQ
jgi:hypothetical protein